MNHIINSEFILFDTLTPKAIETTLQQNLDIARSSLKKIEQSTNMSWDLLQQSLYVPLYNLNQFWTITLHLLSVNDSLELRNLRDKFQQQIAAFYVDLGQSKQLYQHFKHIKESEYKQLGLEEQKIINNEFRDFKLSGIELNEQNQAKFKDIQQQLSQLSSKFEQNILDATDSYSKFVEKHDLSGIPEELLNQYKEAAIAANKPELYKITLHMPSYLPIMQYCDNRKLREELYYHYVTRASEIDNTKFDNAGIICQILHLRDDKAKLLGFNDFSELSLFTKMANNTKQVLDFLIQLANKSKTHASNDLAEVTKFAKTSCAIDHLEIWDIPYFSEKLQQHKYSYSDWELKQYFQVDKVLDGLFKLIYELYQIEFKLNQQIPAWHSDMLGYDVIKNNVVIGHLYLDLYARVGKQSGAWMNSFQDRFITKDLHKKPISGIMCNFTPPNNDNIALLTFDEVQTLFHEMGHALHNLVTEINHFSISGINGVEWDAVELPSQFMEYFAWNRRILSNISCHTKTGKQIPDELYTKITKARYYQSGLAMLRQLEFAILDIKLHTSLNKEFNFTKCQEITAQVREQVAVISPPKYNRFLNSFSHIFAGGYASGYYSYKWAEVLATDIFHQFEQQENDGYSTLGNKFYTTILSKGGLHPMLDNFVAFMQREPQIDALLKYSGIN